MDDWILTNANIAKIETCQKNNVTIKINNIFTLSIVIKSLKSSVLCLSKSMSLNKTLFLDSVVKEKKKKKKRKRKKGKCCHVAMINQSFSKRRSLFIVSDCHGQK